MFVSSVKSSNGQLMLLYKKHQFPFYVILHVLHLWNFLQRFERIDRRNIMLLVCREASYIYQLCIFKRFVSFDLTQVSLFPIALY